MKKTLQIGFTLSVLFCLCIMSFLFTDSDVQRNSETITQVQIGNFVSNEDVEFNTIEDTNLGEKPQDLFLDEKNIEYDIIAEKIAINPNYIYEDIDQTVFATERTIVYTTPEEKNQEVAYHLDKGQSAVIIGTNDFNNTYKIKSDIDGNIYYAYRNSFIDDKNMIFDDVEEQIKYTNTPTVLKDYPSEDAGEIISLNVNQEIVPLGLNDAGYYKVKVNDTEGYIHKDNLSDERVNYVTPEQQTVVNIARNNQGSYPCVGGYCAAWVSGVYNAAGYGWPGGNAIDFWLQWSDSGSTSMDNIPIGAVVVGSGSGSSAGNMYGHVGVYIGDGLVAENIGYHRIISIQDWANTQVGYCRGYHGYIGWVWPNNNPLGEGK